MGIQSSSQNYDPERPGKSIYKIKNNKVYWKGKRIHIKDINFFKILKNNYAIDKNNIFYNGIKIYVNPISDTTKFKVLEYGYARDPVNIFYKGLKIKNADVNSFKISRKIGWANDNKNSYYNGTIQ